MRRLVLVASLGILLLVPVVAVAQPGCPAGWPRRFTALERELDVIVLREGTLFCATSSDGHVSGVIRADGRRSLDDYLPEDTFWEVFGPGAVPTRPPSPSQRPSPTVAPTPVPTPGPSSRSTPTPAPTRIPDTAMGQHSGGQ